MVTIFIYYINQASNPVKKTISYQSKNLEISLEYPTGWLVDENELDVLLASFSTYRGENKKPSNGELQMFIDDFSNCFPTLEEDLRKPACGQGRKEDEIIFKEEQKTPAGIFYKYKTRSFDGEEKIYYFLVGKDRTLKISKQPEVNANEKAFQDIVQSIRFQ